MARSNKLPASLKRLAAKYPDRVQSLEVIRDGFDPASPFSYVMWLKPGWSYDNGERHCVEGTTVAEFMEVWRRVEEDK